ncbi:hypothetical protein C5C37_08810, partial [Rathayibacter sp. AY1F9]
ISTRLLAPLADYLVVNVSSPNTPGLRGLQEIDQHLRALARSRYAAARLLDHQEDTGGRRLALRSATLSPHPPRRTGDPRVSGSS